jgi:hypothetical protein
VLESEGFAELVVWLSPWELVRWEMERRLLELVQVGEVVTREGEGRRWEEGRVGEMDLVNGSSI